MTEIDQLSDNPTRLAWEVLGREGVAMVGTPDPVRLMRPMTVHPAPEECAIWFFTRSDGDFSDDVGDGGPSHLVSMARDGVTLVALLGRVEPSRSALHIDRYWNAVAASRFDGGRDDPTVLLMRFTPQTGRIWRGTGGLLAVGWEFARASLTGERPDLEDTADLVFTPEP